MVWLILRRSCVRGILLSVDARFLSTEWGRWVRRLHGRLYGIVSTEFQDGSLLVFRRAVLERLKTGRRLGALYFSLRFVPVSLPH